MVLYSRWGCEHVVGETFEAACPAGHVTVAPLDRLESGLVQREFRPRALLGEGHRGQQFVARIAIDILPGERENDPLRLNDFAIDAAFPVLGTLRRAHAAAVGATDAD